MVAVGRLAPRDSVVAYIGGELMRIICLLLPLGLAFAQEKPVALYAGTGVWKHPITPKSVEAQRYFDQGLALMYGFNRYESLRSFRKAAELDPSAAMQHWG